MKKLFLTLTLLLGLITLALAQNNFNLFYNKGREQETQQQYYKAIKSYYAAILATDNKYDILKAKVLLDKCAKHLEQQRDEAEQARRPTNKENQSTDSLLVGIKQNIDSVEQIQRKIKTVIFDKAVKEQFPQWLGYDKYNWNLKNDENTKNGLEIISKIDTLDLSYYALLDIPKEVTNCQNLKHINLLGNPDIDWNTVFQAIKKLPVNSVYVSVNDLSDIDNSYWHLITGIALLGTGLTEIPENILQQKQLVYLDLSRQDWSSRNNLSSLPTELYELTNLKYLNLKYCQIESLPPQIGKLTNLAELNLTFNQLTNLPPEIGKLTNLTKLYFKYNQLTNLPAEIGQLTKLTKLDLSGNRLTYLPPEIGKLTNLTKLDLSENKLTELPPEIGELTNLAKLELAENRLASLPPEIGQLTNLIYLNMTYNKLQKIPYTIGKLNKLKVLGIGGNQIDSLPEKLYSLNHLEKLYLWGNKLTEISPKIGMQTNLIELYLSENKLTYLPPEIGKLKNLTELDLSYNQLTTLPTEIGELKTLTELDLSDNQLTTLPTEIGELKNLTRLYLGNNQLTYLPPEMSKLTKLTKLDLKNNNLTRLPSEIGKQTNLKELNVRGNSLDKRLFVSSLEAFSKPVKLTTRNTVYNKRSDYLLIIIDRIEPEWLKLPYVERYE